MSAQSLAEQEFLRKAQEFAWRWDPKLCKATDIALALEQCQRVSWSGIWPMAHCFVTSLLLAPVIRVPMNWGVLVAVGTAAEGKHHAWIETPQGDIVDLTYGMFDGGDPLRVLPASRASELGHVPRRRLTLVEEEFCRNAVDPSEQSGFRPSANIRELFEDPEKWAVETVG